MAVKPTPAQIHHATEQFNQRTKWMIDNLPESWNSWQYVVSKCPEVVSLLQKPGTVMPFGLQPIIERLYARSNWDQVKQKISRDPALHKAFQFCGSFAKFRKEYESAIISWGKEISKAIVAYGWGGENAVDPFLNLEVSGYDLLPWDKQAQLFDVARRQAEKFNLFVQNRPADAAGDSQLLQSMPVDTTNIILNSALKATCPDPRKCPSSMI